EARIDADGEGAQRLRQPATAGDRLTVGLVDVVDHGPAGQEAEQQAEDDQLGIMEVVEVATLAQRAAEYPPAAESETPEPALPFLDGADGDAVDGLVAVVRHDEVNAIAGR